MRSFFVKAALRFALFATLITPSVAFSENIAGTCNLDQTTHPQACIDAIQKLNNNSVVNDIFRDTSGKTADQLQPSQFGKLFQHYQKCDATGMNCTNGCDLANTICNGEYSPDKRGCPSISCTDTPADLTFAHVASFVNQLDWKYANPIRLHENHGMSATHPLCPSWDDKTKQVADGDKDGYHPWEGMVFDLGGLANKAVIFSVNDHGPQPCESAEYVVYLSNNPFSEETIEHTTTDGADPNKWNRAVLSRVYTHGWVDIRDINKDYNASCGDVQGKYTVEADGFTQLYSLPCGITFRYVAIGMGNDGNDGWNGNPATPRPLAACEYHSFDGELDAVAGLTEEGNAICPDADKDGFVDCNCPSAPKVCDCNDADPSVHPGAPVKCDDIPDAKGFYKNCAKTPNACPSDKACYQSICINHCIHTGEVGASCQPGSKCMDTANGKLCIPNDCSVGGCPAGSTCKAKADGPKSCVPNCDGVQCPAAQTCIDGACIDPCQNVTCPPSQTCVAEGVEAKCKPKCSCFNSNLGCADQPGLVCDRKTSNACVPLGCDTLSCQPGQHCELVQNKATCAGVCDNVVCPPNQKCNPMKGTCISNCDTVICSQSDQACNPVSGMCEDKACAMAMVSCPSGQVCQNGRCFSADGGGVNIMVTGAGGASTGAFGAGGGSDGNPNIDGGLKGRAAGAGATTVLISSGSEGAQSGCGCEVAGSGPLSAAAALSGLLAGAALAVRRRRRP